MNDHNILVLCDVMKNVMKNYLMDSITSQYTRIFK